MSEKAVDYSNLSHLYNVYYIKKLFASRCLRPELGQELGPERPLFQLYTATNLTRAHFKKGICYY